MVQEAPERQPGGDRIDVREAREVADDRADGRPAPAPRGEDVTREGLAAHLARAFACELQHLPVEQEEAGQTKLVDQGELLAQTLACARVCASPVPMGERLVADSC